MSAVLTFPRRPRLIRGLHPVFAGALAPFAPSVPVAPVAAPALDEAFYDAWAAEIEAANLAALEARIDQENAAMHAALARAEAARVADTWWFGELKALRQPRAIFIGPLRAPIVGDFVPAGADVYQGVRGHGVRYVGD